MRLIACLIGLIGAHAALPASAEDPVSGGEDWQFQIAPYAWALAIYDWNEDEFFQIPVGGAVGRVFHIGKQPMNIFAQSWYNPVESDRGASPNYTFKLNVTFLFPE